MAVGRHRGADEAGVESGEHRAQVVDEYVGLPDQVEEDPPAVRVAQVEGDRPLALVHDHVGDGVDPVGVAGQRLDLDHVGTVVGENGAGEGPGQEGAQVDDPQPGQGESDGAGPGWARPGPAASVPPHLLGGHDVVVVG